MDEEIKRRITASLAKDPHRPNCAIGKSIRTGERTLNGRASAAMVAEVRESLEIEGRQPAAKGATQMAGNSEFMSIGEVLAKHDVIGQAEEIVKDIPAGQLMTDIALRQRLGLGSDRWKRARGSLRLNDYWTTLPDKSIMWGSKKTTESVAAQIKEILI